MKLRSALLILSVFSLVGGFIFSYRSGLIDKLINGNRFNFSTASKHPDYYLKINDKKNLEKAFNMLGYSYGRHIKDKGIGKSKLGGIRFILTNSPQSAYTVTTPEGRVLKSAGFDFDPKRQELLVYIHFSDEILKEILSNDQGIINATILDYLCIGDDGFKGADSMDNCTVIRKSVLGLYGSKTRLFSLERKKKLSFKIIKDVYAGCTGTYTCCVATSTCTCSRPGYTCTEAGQSCGDYGLCSCSTQNVVAETNDCAGNGGSCGHQAPSCTSGTWFPCGGNSCAQAGPTPTPGGPTPTPGGGGGECPVGQVLYCPQPYQYWCVSVGECQSRFPSMLEPGPVVCAGKEELGNLRYDCRQCECVTSCNATAPTITSVAANSGTSATVKWTPGTGGDSQRVYIGTDKPMVESNCPNGTGVGSGCVKKATGLPTTDTSYTVNNLSPGWLYYYRVVNFKETSCQAASPTVSAFSSCELSPAALTLQIDQSAPLETQVSASPPSAISFVRWSEDTNYVSLNVHQDNSTPYTTRVTALAATNPTTTVTSEVLMPGDTIPDCTDTSLVTVSQPGPWVQAAGGDVYAAGLLESPLPKGISPREFVLDGSLGETPGVVTYGSNFDLAVETGGSDPKGRKLVSSSDWLVHETYTKVDYYDYFYRRFGAPTTPDYDHPAAPITQPTARATPYYVVGNMTTSGNWNVGNGKTLIFIVNGNLTISGKIKVTGRSFVAFIVNGHITVSPSVGSAYTNSTAPDIEGVYITSSNKTFFTGTGQTAAKARLVLKGIFVAGNFTLQRNLSDVNQNDSTSAELFIYNPMYFITMPDKMKEVKIKWEEVAP